jgi:hypothetical protein
VQETKGAREPVLLSDRSVAHADAFADWKEPSAKKPPHRVAETELLFFAATVYP